MNAPRLDDLDPEILRLDLGIEDITLGHLIEAQERFLSLTEDLTEDAYLRLWRHRTSVDWDRPILP